MTIEFILIISILIAGIITILLLINKKIGQIQSKPQDQALLQWLSSMQQTLEHNNQTLSTVLNQTNKNITDSPDSAGLSKFYYSS